MLTISQKIDVTVSASVFGTDDADDRSTFREILSITAFQGSAFIFRGKT
jgi:hypothetical protein